MSYLLLAWNDLPRLEWELNNLSAILRVDRAHVVMMAEEKVITEAQAGALLRELKAIQEAGPEDFRTEYGYGSLVLQIENTLTIRLGDSIAGRLPIARSRLDQGATVKRMCDRENILAVLTDLLVLQNSLIMEAVKHADVAMIGYTHLQQAQPSNFGQYLLAFKSRLEDSSQQLTQAYDRVDRCPLGAVGLSGTDVPINRHRTAALLGFQSILPNSRLGYDIYFQVEIAFLLASVMIILNDLCSDLHVFSSIEFGTVELDDSHCSTSSVFPQKKNPYALETVKGKAGESHGWVVAALATVRNEGTCDTGARTVSCLDEAYRTTRAMTRLTAEIINGLTVHENRLEALLEKAWVTTNRLGNTLLAKYGLDYRSAHGVVARLVRNCINQGTDKSSVEVHDLSRAAREMGMEPIEMTEDELMLSLDHHDFILNSTSYGGVSPSQVAILLKESRAKYNLDRFWLEDKVQGLKEADAKLDEASQKFLQSEI